MFFLGKPSRSQKLSFKLRRGGLIDVFPWHRAMRPTPLVLVSWTLTKDRSIEDKVRRCNVFALKKPDLIAFSVDFDFCFLHKNFPIRLSVASLPNPPDITARMIQHFLASKRRSAMDWQLCLQQGRSSRLIYGTSNEWRAQGSDLHGGYDLGGSRPVIHQKSYSSPFLPFFLLLDAWPSFFWWTINLVQDSSLSHSNPARIGSSSSSSCC